MEHYFIGTRCGAQTNYNRADIPHVDPKTGEQCDCEMVTVEYSVLWT